MPFDIKIGPFPNLDQLFLRDTNIDFHHAMAFPTREVMVVPVTAGPVGVVSTRKFDPVQQSHIDQHLDRPEGKTRTREIIKETPHSRSLSVGAPGIEPGTSCTPCKRASRTALRPELRQIIR